MKQITFLPTLRKAATGLAAAAALLLSLNADAAPGCRVGSLIINTGYDPATGTATSGSTDPRWTVSALSPDASSAIGLSAGYNAYTVALPSSFGWTGNTSASMWISADPRGYYTTTGTGTFLQTFQRSFTTCSTDDIDFDIDISNDNWCTQIRVDGTPLPIGSPWGQPAVFNSLNYTSFTTIPTFTVNLGPGTHTIEVDVYNNQVWNSFNPCGLQIIGNITSPGNTIVSEAPGCKSFTCCDASFTYCINTSNPLDIDLNANDPSQPGSFDWIIDGSMVGSGPSFVWTFATGGAHTICLQYTDPATGDICDRKCITICLPDKAGGDDGSGGDGIPGDNMRRKLESKPGSFIGKVYPNPVNTEVNIDLSNSLPGETTVTIYDVTGKSVMQQALRLDEGMRTITMATGQLTPGVYLISINNGTTMVMEKFIKK